MRFAGDESPKLPSVTFLIVPGCVVLRTEVVTLRSAEPDWSGLLPSSEARVEARCCVFAVHRPSPQKAARVLVDLLRSRRGRNSWLDRLRQGGDRCVIATRAGFARLPVYSHMRDLGIKLPQAALYFPPIRYGGPCAFANNSRSQPWPYCHRHDHSALIAFVS